MSNQKKQVKSLFKRARWNRILLFFGIIIVCLSFGFNALGGVAPENDIIYHQEIIVKSGDSIWKLIKDANPDYSGNMSEAVYLVKSINSLETATLQVGQVLRVPMNLQ